jgi:hypothetical protein
MVKKKTQKYLFEIEISQETGGFKFCYLAEMDN